MCQYQSFLPSLLQLIIDVNIEETQRQLLETMCDLSLDKLKSVSSSATVESVLEVFHRILKDFRHRLSVEGTEHNLLQHAGCRLLNILNERLEVEKIMNIDNESNNLIIVPTL